MLYAVEACSRFGFAIIKLVYRRLMALLCITQDSLHVTLEGYFRIFVTVYYFPTL
jgi:hypothetical protein